MIVKPETVIGWHRKGFRLYWTSKSRRARPGRPEIPLEVRDLIRKMSVANPLWGASRIHGELLKLGINLSQATVAKYMGRPRKALSQTWRTFLNNHVRDLVAVDFFTVPTITFRGYLIQDRDTIYGEDFRQRVQAMGIDEVLTALRSPWQNAYAQRLIGSIRRECLDHLIVLNESSQRRILRSYFDYYQGSRTHLALGIDAPEPREVQPPTLGPVIELPEMGGLHHRFVRRAG